MKIILNFKENGTIVVSTNPLVNDVEFPIEQIQEAELLHCMAEIAEKNEVSKKSLKSAFLKTLEMLNNKTLIKL